MSAIIFRKAIRPKVLETGEKSPNKFENYQVPLEKPNRQFFFSAT